MSMSFIIFTSALHFHPKIIQHFFLYSKTPPIVIRTFLSMVSKAKKWWLCTLGFHKNVPTKKLDITKINCWEKFNIFSEPTIKEVEKVGGRRNRKEKKKDKKKENRPKSMKIKFLKTFIQSWLIFSVIYTENR